MTEAPPRVFTIPSSVPFAETLAAGLLDRWGRDPLALTRATILVPTRRSCRSLREAFLRAADGQALLLPRISPLGDLDAEELLFAEETGLPGIAEAGDLPPAMPPLRRQLLLTQLIIRRARSEAAAPNAGLSEDQAARLADELARLIDQVETEGLDFDRLAGLVPEDYATHWQETLEFLKIVTEHWPAIQAEEGCIGPAERRRLLLEAQTAQWRAAPPADPVVVAGSTGSIPATATLMQVVAGLPEGMVVLPGVDRTAGEDDWTAIADDPGHPQHGIARLLHALAVAPAAVRDWPGVAPSPLATARADFINIALRPASATPNWRGLAVAAPESDAVLPDRGTMAKAVTDVRRIDCAEPGEEATVVALLMRQALETPDRTAALVTLDRALARRVAAELKRWDIEIDDSAGVPLADTAPGSFLRLTAEMVAGRLAPLPLLAALKHPLAAGGQSEVAFRSRVRALEVAVLRGPRPGPGFDGLRGALAESKVDDTDLLLAWLDDLAAMAAPFEAALSDPAQGLGAILTEHVGFAEALAASDAAPGAARLWDKEAGEAAAEFVAELRQAVVSGPALQGERYPALLHSLLSGRVVRPRYGSHPRLSILGPLEARMVQADVMILAGLNEGTWPVEVDPGPWLSRPMRRDFGLPSPERRIGLSAHDFVQAFCAAEVFLTRSARVEGTPTVACRWLLRIDALLRTLDLPEGLKREGALWQAWAMDIDRPTKPLRIGPPFPRPPLDARPRRLSVTQVETWMRDPYGLYARTILNLRPLDPIDADPGAAERGNLIHRALELYLSAHPTRLPADPAAELLAIGAQVFRPLRARPGLYAFWWPRYVRIARWFAVLDLERRRDATRAWAEVAGQLSLDGPAGRFDLLATADRIERRGDGGLAVIDYKTGAIPTQKEVDLGFAPQLPLEAAIAAAGGFAEVPAAAPTELSFWRLTGGEPPGETRPVKAVGPDLAAAARDGLAHLVAAYDDPATGYPPIPRPEWAPRFNDYAHLARVKEWSAGTLWEAGV